MNRESFSVEHAIRFGVSKAVLIEAIIGFYIQKDNREVKEADGYLWIRIPSSKLHDRLPYFTKKQASRWLLELVRNDGFIRKSRKYNESHMDSTNWYTIPTLFRRE